jgi:hypothetical protein
MRHPEKIKSPVNNLNADMTKANISGWDKTFKAHKEEVQILLKKRMHHAEKYQNWIYMPKAIRTYFPPGEVVTVMAGGREVEMKINKHGYMNPCTVLWETFAQLLEFDKNRDTLVFIKHANGRLEITCEKDAP